MKPLIKLLASYTLSQTMRKLSPKIKSPKPLRSQKVPVTKAMLDHTEKKLKAEMTSLRLETRAGFKRMEARFNGTDSKFKSIDSRFKSIDARFKSIDARFKNIDARFNNIDAQFLDLKSEIKKVLAAVHYIGLRVDAQEARNLYVLDGYTSLSDRLDKIEKDCF
jgi:septation ring formation regulator EzrA